MLTSLAIGTIIQADHTGKRYLLGNLTSKFKKKTYRRQKSKLI